MLAKKSTGAPATPALPRSPRQDLLAGPLTDAERAALGPHWYPMVVPGVSLICRGLMHGEQIIIASGQAPVFGQIVAARVISASGIHDNVLAVWMTDGATEWLQCEGGAPWDSASGMGHYTGNGRLDCASFTVRGVALFHEYCDRWHVSGKAPTFRERIVPHPPRAAGANGDGAYLLPSVPAALSAVGVDVPAAQAELDGLVADYDRVRWEEPADSTLTNDIIAFWMRLHALGAPLRAGTPQRAPGQQA